MLRNSKTKQTSFPSENVSINLTTKVKSD